MSHYKTLWYKIYNTPGNLLGNSTWSSHELAFIIAIKNILQMCGLHLSIILIGIMITSGEMLYSRVDRRAVKFKKIEDEVITNITCDNISSFVLDFNVVYCTA